MIDNLEIFDEQVDRFLKNRMTAEEEKAFKTLLTNDPEKKSRARTIALMIQQMKEIGREEDIRIIERIKAQAAEPVHKGKTLSIGIRLLAYAASLLLIIAIGLGGNQYYTHRQIVSLGEEYLDQVPTSLSGHFRGSQDDEVITELTTLFTNVETGKELPATIDTLTRLYQEAGGEYVTPYSDYANDIAWHLAIAHLKEGNREAALPVLKQLVQDNEGKAIADKANELIGALKKI